MVAPLTVRCAWVPGTLDLVQVVIEKTGEYRMISVNTVYKLMGREVADSLYLSGKAEFSGGAELLPLFDMVPELEASLR